MRTLAFAIVLGSGALTAQDDAGRWWPDAIQSVLDAAPARAADAWRDALVSAPAEHRDSLAFLLEHMPAVDVDGLEPKRIVREVALAHEAFAATPWHDRVPADVFRNAVLPYVNVTESRDAWRTDFHERFRDRVADCKTPSEAAQRLNETIFGELGVRYSTKRKRADQSPKESIEIGMASCTGLSILLVDACRAVGVPARLAGIPRWPNKPGNHTWVEIWDDGWQFTGAAEPNAAGMNHTWFQADAALAKKGSVRNAIWAVSYANTGDRFPLVWSRGDTEVWGVDVTDRYTPTAAAASDDSTAASPDTTRLMVRVRAAASGERLRAHVALIDPESKRVRFAGRSKDEAFDTNDLLEFRIDSGTELIVRATAPGCTPAENSLRAEGAQTVIDLELQPLPDPTEALHDALVTYFEASADARGEWTFADEHEAMLAADDAAVRAIAAAAYRAAEIHATARADFDAKRVRTTDRESPYTLELVGERPANGWPLVIAMHGGGGVPKRVNDRQWRHMQVYYRKQEQLPGYAYLALRAPNDTWNGFYDTAIAPLVTELIRQFTLFGEVDADRVYLIGYSHGGYGAFGIGPKIADRFAAVHASAAAPTPGITAAENLRTTPFTYMIGEKDTAYGRADRCKAFADEIAALRGERDDVYPVTLEWQAGYGHGGLPDRDKVAVLYEHARDATPTEVSWRPTGPEVHSLFWLEMTSPSGKVTAVRDGNRIELEVDEAAVDSGLALALDARLVDFDQPIELVVNGGEATRHDVQPSLRRLCDSLLERGGDAKLASTTRLVVPFATGGN